LFIPVTASVLPPHIKHDAIVVVDHDVAVDKHRNLRLAGERHDLVALGMPDWHLNGIIFKAHFVQDAHHPDAVTAPISLVQFQFRPRRLHEGWCASHE
jgi:hypothetical protein